MSRECGFIVLSRKFWDHKLWTEKRQFSLAEAWIDLIHEAAWADHGIVVKMKSHHLLRGQVPHSYRTLAKRWGWGKNKVSRFLDLLENECMIKRCSETGTQTGTDIGTAFNPITITNYDTYQSVDAKRGTANGTANGTATGQTRDTTGTNITKETKGTKETNNKDIVDSGFDQFWEAYGKKVGKATCEKKWARLTDKERTVCMSAVPKYVSSTPDIQFRKHPATYLNGRHWDDDIELRGQAAATTDSEWWVCRSLCARPEPKHKCPDGQCYTCRTDREVITAKDRDEAVAKMKEKIDRECAF
jgi:hypothetical protein